MDGNSYFERHWRGELSLRLSYWVNHVLIGGLGLMLLLSGVAAVQRAAGERPLPCLLFVLSLFFLWSGLQIWQIAGTWRSAARARVAGGGRRARRIQRMLCLSVLASLALPVFTVLPMAQAAIAGRPIAISGVVSSADGRIIEFDGPIDRSSAEAFRRVVDSARPRLVRLHSNGGLVMEARAMAALIRARGLDTEVSQACVSACTIAFFAGRRRVLVGSGTLGFHSYSSMEETPQAILLQERWDRQAYLAGGVAPGFVEHMFTIPPARVWYPSREESEAAGFATRPGTR